MNSNQIESASHAAFLEIYKWDPQDQDAEHVRGYFDVGFVRGAAWEAARATAAPQAAGVPEGWRMRKDEDGVIVVQHQTIGGYAARRDENNIAASILWELANAMLAAAPQPPVAWEDAMAFYCVNTVSGKMKFTLSPKEAAEMRDCKTKHWQVTPLGPITAAPASSPAVPVGQEIDRAAVRKVLQDLYTRMQSSYMAEPTRRITFMDMEAVHEHVRTLGLGGCLDEIVPESTAPASEPVKDGHWVIQHNGKSVSADTLTGCMAAARQLRTPEEAAQAAKNLAAAIATDQEEERAERVSASQVDWLGLALDLEQQAKRVESQTAERAMRAAAHGLRLLGSVSASEPVTAKCEKCGGSGRFFAGYSGPDTGNKAKYDTCPECTAPATPQAASVDTTELRVLVINIGRAYARNSPSRSEELALIAHIKALVDATRKDGYIQAEQDFAATLPGTYYMDPPDGGSVTVLEQVRRMAEDAAKARDAQAGSELVGLKRYGLQWEWMAERADGEYYRVDDVHAALDKKSGGAL